MPSLQRRTLRVLAAAQVFGGVGFFMGITVAALLAREVSGSDALSGIPLAFTVAAGALGAVPLAGSMARAGRRPVSGWLADRFGRLPVIAGGGFALIAAGALAAASPGDETVLLALALAALGVGWNLGLVGGSALLTDAVEPERRAQTQGAADLVMGLTGVTGNLVAGPLFHAGAFAVLGVGAAIVGGLVVLLAARARPAVTAAAG